MNLYWKINEKTNNRLHGTIVSIDQTIKVMIYGGNPDITISDAIGRRKKQGIANRLELLICKVLNVFDNEHCKKSFEQDEYESLIR